MKHRIGIVGTGHVGSEVANEIVRMNVGDCIMIDCRDDIAKAKSFDLSQAAPMRYSSVSVFDGGDFHALAGCDVVVLSAGVPRHPGMSRDDLLDVNLEIVKKAMPLVMGAAPEAVLIVITNPLDAMTYAAWKISGKDPRSVFGMAGALDSSRFASFLAGELAVSPEDVHAMVLGSHGNLMVPLARYASVSGIPVADLIDGQAMGRILQRTKNAGTELVTLFKSGSAYYAAGAATAAMIDSIVNDKHKVYCCSALCRGMYGLDGVYIGVPTVLGASGIERVLELKLNEAESRDLHAAAEHLRGMQDMVDSRLG